PSRRRLFVGRRVVPRSRLLGVLGYTDQAALRFLRTRGHAEPAETVMKALGHAGEFGAVWAGIGAVGASIDHRRRSQWIVGGGTGALAIGIQDVGTRVVGRE